MKRTLNLTPINYWTEQPFLNRAVAAGGNDVATVGSYGLRLVPMDSPDAVFELLWDGGGTISVQSPAAVITTSEPGHIVFTWKGGPLLQLNLRAAGQKNIRVVRQDQLAAFNAGEFWRPDFLTDLEGFTAFRAMDWMRTNGSARSDVLIEGGWPTVAADGNGIAPLDMIVDLANRTGLRPWINLPHLVTDAAAKAVYTYLDAHSTPRPIIEYSNEMWNGSFAQTKWAQTQAPATRANDNNYAYGFRAGQLAMLARGSKIDFVLCGQLVVPSRMANVFAGAKDAGAADTDFAAIGPATYITGDLVDYGKFPTLALGLMSGGNIDGAHENMMAALPKWKGYYADWGALAKAHGLKLWAYEGGNFHLNAKPANGDWDKLRQFFVSVQQAPRAVDTMRAYSQAWADAGADMDALYNLASNSTIDGFFGLKQQPLLWQWVKADMAPPVVVPPADTGAAEKAPALADALAQAKQVVATLEALTQSAVGS